MEKLTLLTNILYINILYIYSNCFIDLYILSETYNINLENELLNFNFCVCRGVVLVTCPNLFRPSYVEISFFFDGQ